MVGCIPVVESSRGGAATSGSCDQPNQPPLFPEPYRSATLPAMTAPDPALAQIAARFDSFTVKGSRGGYTLHDRQSGTAVARLKPIPDSDRFELLLVRRPRPLANLRRLRPPPAHPGARPQNRSRRNDLPPADALNARQFWPKSSLGHLVR
jgi:hypothetical protein